MDEREKSASLFNAVVFFYMDTNRLPSIRHDTIYLPTKNANKNTIFFSLALSNKFQDKDVSLVSLTKSRDSIKNKK